MTARRTYMALRQSAIDRLQRHLPRVYTAFRASRDAIVPRARLLLPGSRQWSDLRMKLPIPLRLPWGDYWIPFDDVTSRQLRGKGGFESGEQALVSAFLHEGMTVLDIGAHHGFYTLLASHRVGETGKVIAFEPSERERRRLKRHLALNRRRNVMVEPFAVSDGSGSVKLYVCQRKETGCNSLRPPAVDEPTLPLEVPMITLDAYLDRCAIGDVDFIKMDIEGAEKAALNGAKRLLASRNRPAWLCELVDLRTRPWGYESADIYRFFVDRGYRWFSISGSGRLKPCEPKPHFHENLLAVPEEKLQTTAGLMED